MKINTGKSSFAQCAPSIDSIDSFWTAPCSTLTVTRLNHFSVPGTVDSPSFLVCSRSGVYPVHQSPKCKWPPASPTRIVSTTHQIKTRQLWTFGTRWKHHLTESTFRWSEGKPILHEYDTKIKPIKRPTLKVSSQLIKTYSTNKLRILERNVILFCSSCFYTDNWFLRSPFSALDQKNRIRREE